MVTIKSLEKNLTYAEKAFHALKRMIMLGQLPSDSIINERELSEQLGISRTPLRDALQLLEAKGWVTKDGKSRRITSIDLTGLESDLQIRRVLETLSIELMMDKLSDDDLDMMTEYVDAMENADIDYVAFLELDQQFHTYLAKISANVKLYALLDDSCEQILRYCIASLRNSVQRRKEVQHDHRKMLELLNKRDKQGYLDFIKKHLTNISMVLENSKIV